MCATGRHGPPRRYPRRGAVAGAADRQHRGQSAPRRRYQWFNSLPTAQAVQCLVETGMSPDLATEIERQRPLNEGWLPSEQRHWADDGTTISYRALASMIEGKVR